jgi:uncharacterized membrane protein
MFAHGRIPIDPLPASLMWGQPEWLGFAAALAVGSAVLVATVYWRAAWPGPMRWIAGLLKGSAFALIAVCLLEPLWSGTRAKPGENLVLIVVDSSASLQIADGPQNQARSGQFAAALFNEQLPWQVRLGQDFRVRRYTLAERLDAVQTFDGLAWEGAGSTLATSLETLLERYHDEPVAAVLLFTDGITSDDGDVVAALRENGPAVFPVLPRTIAGLADVSVERTSISQSSFEDAPVTIQADVRALGAGLTGVTAQLLDDSGAIVGEQSRRLDAAVPLLPFRFNVRPIAEVSHYRLQVTGDNADGADSDAIPAEATLANNERLITVQRRPGPYRVLYVGGRPNWEFKFLRRALATDTDLRLVGLIRMARREAKFEFLGREGESSNPLFRGFRREGDEETESYDEPVIIAVGVENERELVDGGAAATGARFPRTAEELFAYHAILIDDTEAEFFSREQQALIERFVSVRGGGLLMLGGPGSFHHGGWQKTAVKDVLPVYIDRTPEPIPFADADPPVEQRLQLTRDGWLQPWVRLRATEQEERERLEAMSGFQVVSRVNGLKPAAQVLASVVDARGANQPALVAQQYGHGRGAALLVGDLWRWSLAREAGAPDDAAKAWRQLVRWLVTDVPRQVETSLEWSRAGESRVVTIRVQVRDGLYQPQDNATVKLTITGPDAVPLTLTAEPALDAPGVFTAAYVPRQAGAYRGSIDVIDAGGEPLGGAQVGWSHEPQAEEFRRLEVDRDAMARLAEESGGEVLTPDDLGDFAESLPSRNVPRQESWTSPLWHSPAMLAAILVLLVGEWGLRRWRGLP